MGVCCYNCIIVLYCINVVLIAVTTVYVTGPAKTGHVGTRFLPTFSHFLYS